MPFVQAKCPECGGMLAVDADKKAANCQFCGEAFIVQEAINNYNTYNETINNYNTTYQYGNGAVVNVYEDKSKDFVIEAGVLKEYHGKSKEIIIPNCVDYIEAACFIDLPIVKIEFLSDLDESNLCEFLENCFYLTSIKFSSNKKYCFDNGIVFNSDRNRIIYILKSYLTNNIYVCNSCNKMHYQWKAKCDFCNQYSTFSEKIINSISNAGTFIIPDYISEFSSYATKEIEQICKSVYWKKQDLFDLSCTELDILKDTKSFPYKITKHSFIYGKCEFCGKENIVDGFSIMCKKYNSDSIGAYLISDNVYGWTIRLLNSVFHSSTTFNLYFSRDEERFKEKTYKCKNLIIDSTFNIKDIDSNLFTSIIKYLENIETIFIESDLYIPIHLKSLKTAIIKEGVTYLPLFECSKLEKIQLPSTVKIIPNNCFKNCLSLKEINLSENIEKIEAFAFQNCRSLERITLPANLKNVYAYAFDGCDKLNDIYISNEITYKIQSDVKQIPYQRLGYNIFDGTSIYTHCKYAFSDFWRKQNKCRQCGGDFKKTLLGNFYCKNCGMKKDY